jgi:hypothetical protein
MMTKLRWPMPFRLQDCDASLLERARERLSLSQDYAAPPDVVHRTFLGFGGDEAWAPGFLGVRWLTREGELDRAVMDEFYVFMSMRVRVIEHVPARRSVAVVERWSLPLARRMVQVVETTPLADGRTRLTYEVAYDVPPALRWLHPPIAAVFERWFALSLRGLARYLERQA